MRTYPFHKAALLPLLPGANEDVLIDALGAVNSNNEGEFIQFLLNQGLAPLWAEQLEQHDDSIRLSEESRNTLKAARLQATGEYMLQHSRLQQTREILDAAGIPHAVFKGASNRERLFANPALRPSVDQDVLVTKESKVEAIIAYREAGYTFYGTPKNISHECNLIKGKNSIDLHWDILRPGRTRTPMTQTLLDTSQDFGSHWGLDTDATLYMLLVHPVFTKYLTAPQAILVRQLDLVYLLERTEPDWPRVIDWLDCSGLKTAGWLSLEWLRKLAGYHAPEAVMESLQPARLRRHYLLHWLEHDLATRWQQSPALIQLGLTLPAHDRPQDALHATQTARACRKNGERHLKSLEAML